MKKLICALLVLIIVISASSVSFAATTDEFINYTDSFAKEVLDLVNQERARAGLPSLAWEQSLVSFATVRAQEIMDVKHWSHTRPNGLEGIDFPNVNGENLAYGTIYSAREVVNGWMNSPGHRANIMRPQFTSMAVVCLGNKSNGLYYWAQLFNARTYGTVDETTIVEQAQKAISSRTPVIITNHRYMTRSTVTRLAQLGSGLTIHADMRTQDKSIVQGRLYVKPADIIMQGDRLALGVWTDPEVVADTKRYIEQYFTNKVAIVELDQKGAYGARMQVTAMVNLTGLNTNSLVFYAYDSATNKLQRLENPGYSIDASGAYLHFYTEVGGSIVITDRELALRQANI